MTFESRPRLIVVLPHHASEQRVHLREWLATVREFCERGGEAYLLAPRRVALARFDLDEHPALHWAAEPALAQRGRNCVVRAMRRRLLAFVFTSLVVPGATVAVLDLTARSAAARGLLEVAARRRVPTIALLRRGPTQRVALAPLLANADVVVLPDRSIPGASPLGSFTTPRRQRVSELFALAKPRFKGAEADP